jgi:hypothetical protein
MIFRSRVLEILLVNKLTDRQGEANEPFFLQISIGHNPKASAKKNPSITQISLNRHLRRRRKYFLLRRSFVLLSRRDCV